MSVEHHHNISRDIANTTCSNTVQCSDCIYGSREPASVLAALSSAIDRLELREHSIFDRSSVKLAS